MVKFCVETDDAAYLSSHPIY